MCTVVACERSAGLVMIVGSGIPRRGQPGSLCSGSVVLCSGSPIRAYARELTRAILTG